ncbi:MAG: hypothetical protein IPK75_19600 [Acidobacteria bacterium]|nr:hypothetical protein [Acidobacteriota bacterium]
MALGKPAGTAGLARPLAMLACAVALGLLVWRGAVLLTGPGKPVSASPVEAALADVLAPVAGPGLSRLSVTYNAEGGRTVLLLLDETASDRIPDLQRIAALAAGINPAQGDRLVIETIAFAGGLPGRPDAAAWTELAGLALLVLVSGALAVLSGKSAPVAGPVSQVIDPPIVSSAPERVRPLRPVAVPDAAVDLARRDPAQAAAIVRGWIKGDAS